MWLSLRRKAWLLAVVITAGSCGGGPIDEVAQDSSTTSSTSTTSTTSTSTTTTTIPPTTSTTLPPTAAELRSNFIQSLEAEQWVEYSDEVIGWSIWYPHDWEVVIEEPGGMFALAVPGGGLFVVGVLLDATDEDFGSYDYLMGNVESSVRDGVLRPIEDAEEFWLDHDFDGSRGPVDIAGLETFLATDPLTGEAIPEGALAPVWWYGYYNPDLRPDYGYIFETIGVNPVLFDRADDLVLSFAPPEVRD